MKNSLVTKFIASVLAVTALAVTANANGFQKKQEYKDGQFADVPAKQWYAAEVKSAYELGFMNGQSDTAFAPDGNVTVAEGITMASRVHASYNSKTIAEKAGGKWYDMYVAYATENGLIKEGQFTNYDRNIMRYEMAQMFADSMPADYFAAKNDIKDIPDVKESEEYYDDLMMLYKAGVVLGSDDYGNFFATNPIKRSETAAIINRVALPANRKEGTLKEYGDRNPAVYLIEDEKMTRPPRNVIYIASGWTFENPSNSLREKKDYSFNVMQDVSDTQRAIIRKEIPTVKTGKLTLEAYYVPTAPGSNVILEDLEGNLLFELRHKSDKKMYAIGKEEKEIGFEWNSGNLNLKLEIDMDTREATVHFNQHCYGTYKMSDVADFSRLCFATSEKEMLNLSVNTVLLYWNFDVNDDFRYNAFDTKPYEWDVTESVTVVKKNNDTDTQTVQIMDAGSAVKKFEKVSGMFVYETYFRVPKGQDAALSIKNSDKTALSVFAKDGKITTADGKFVRNYTEGVWQQVRVEADTDKDTALIKINGKKCLTVPFTEDGIDSIEIVANGKGDFNFDDVKVFNTYEYPDYCPTPVPVNNDEWHSAMSICSLWREGTHYGWDCISPYEDLTPVIGYYDEGIPEAMDWEIKFMVEHGYDYQRFCWYYGGFNENIKKPSLCDDAIHDGYFNAKYSDMLGFSLMWENAGNIGSKDEFFDNIWPYWVDWYISDSRYYCIDNKPVITIYQPTKFKEIMGGVEGANAALEFMEDECKKLGYDGAIFYVSHSTGSPEANKELVDMGYDAKVAYHFGDLAYEAQYQKDRMNTEFEAGHITFSASVGVGFNDIGWTETRTPLATVEEFENILRWSRDEYLPRYAGRDVDKWHTKSLITNTWNEFGEGHYVFPSGLNGFGYLDAHRRVFSSVADTADAKHFDVVPTDNQKERLGYLYTTRVIPMRKTYNDGEYDDGLSDLIPIKSWKFDNLSTCQLWASLAKTTNPTFDEKEMALVAKTTDRDGHIKMISTEENYFNAKDVKWFHVCMKLDKSSASTAEIYFTNDHKGQYTGSMGTSFSIIADGEYHDYYVDLTKLSTWSGDIKSLRFDPANAPVGFYIKTIEFLSNVSADSVVFDVDGFEFGFDASSHVVDGKDIYIEANPTTGFYMLNQFYYEWNRWNGTLLLRTNNNMQFEFVEGSDKVLVDGVEKSLKKAFTVEDGLAVLPITFIYDLAGYDYTVDGNKIKVNVRAKDLQNVIDTRVENEYEFNVPGDLEGFGIFCASGGVADGVAKFTSNYDDKNKRYDPQFANSKMNVDTKLYESVSVRIKADFDDSDGGKDTKLGMYFTTSLDGAMNEKKNVKVDLATLTPDAEGFVIATIDLKAHELWQGVCKSVRFDPSNRAGTFYIDYIRFNMNPDFKAAAEAAAKVNAEAEANFKKADEGAPFYVKNADAEIASIADEFSNGASLIYVVDDDLRPGNKAFLITTNNKNKTWTYLVMPTRFKPGVTYQVDYELRLVGDIKGNPAENVSISPNFRYASFNADGTIKESADHPITGKIISTSDGWVKVSVKHKVAADSPLRTGDRFTIFSNPKEVDGVVTNFQYMVDNIVVTVVEE